MSDTFKVGDPVIYRGKTYSFPGHICGITDDGQYIVRAIGAPDGSFAGMKHIYGAAQLETRDEAPAPQTHVVGSNLLREAIQSVEADMAADAPNGETVDAAHYDVVIPYEVAKKILSSISPPPAEKVMGSDNGLHDGECSSNEGFPCNCPSAAFAGKPASETDAMGTWLPIETAPEDGTAIIVAVPKRDRDGFIIGEAYYDPENYEGGDWWWAGTSYGNGGPISDLTCGPTLWMPLPAPPVVSAEEQ